MNPNNPFNWFNGRHDYEMIDTTLSVGTLRRLTAIAKNNNNVNMDDMDVDTLVNVALDWQRRMYEKVNSELNKFTRKMIKGE